MGTVLPPLAPTAAPLAVPIVAPTPAWRLQWGAHDEDFPDLAGLNGIIALMGGDIQFVHWYVQWSGYTNYPTGYHWSDNADLVRAQHLQDRIPMITWEAWDSKGHSGTNPFPLNRIAAGAFDPYLDEWARGIASVAPGLVYIRLFHEPNITYQPGGYPWTVREGRFSNDPATYVAAWRHVHDRFAAAGATNVRWVFNASGDLANNPMPTAAYPGDAYVDFIGWDAYGDVPAGSMAKDYATVAALSPRKPMILGEVSGDAKWVRTELTSVALPGSRVQAIVWFNEGALALRNTGAAEAFRTLIASP